ncbi:carboxymuconolactone decarboxylase family protein [Scleromatobacter humisilvae]|uniref:Carboxymuconolactone decarboxylase family protein n=1 Tax=Scleromatobacter humisilvae TaxID=2897159 RepID=A0A9X2BYG4_9BURK|nr:carboxymuconolactone decarboxylase family protein [Scleromatobacter humisilvae]MCK9685367.1 carboxymuconolactone decarboxylase family protein [Scleromatobacter humisilvae]
MKNPALVLEGANAAIRSLISTVFSSGVPKSTLDLVGLRTGQMNNCELCIGQSLGSAEPGEAARARLDSVATWRAASCFSESERAALELCEAATTLANRYDSVPDALWRELKRHYDEKPLAGLVLFVAAMNMFTRVNVCTRQTQPEWVQAA